MNEAPSADVIQYAEARQGKTESNSLWSATETQGKNSLNGNTVMCIVPTTSIVTHRRVISFVKGQGINIHARVSRKRINRSKRTRISDK